MNKKALIIGYGSIGRRHTSVLQSLSVDVSLVTRQIVADLGCFPTITSAFQSSYYDLVVIASPTMQHYLNILELVKLDYDGTVLCEKPLFTKKAELPTIKFTLFVGYNLRFSKLLNTLKSEINGQKIINILANVGQYLPSWRPTQDYRQSYSADKKQGGGVLRDLSHELDYITWLGADVDTIVAAGGKYSNLDIDCEDIVSIIMNGKALISINMNYVFHSPIRHLMVTTDTNTYFLDFINGILRKNNVTFAEQENDVGLSYTKMHEALLKQDESNLCNLQQGLNIMALIEKIENTITNQWWEKI